MKPGTFLRLLRTHADTLSAAAAILALAVAVLLGVPAPCAPTSTGGSPAPSWTALPLEPQPVPEGTRPGVLVLVFPGVGQDLADRALAEGTFHHLGRLAAQGVYVSALRLPEATAPGWAEWVLSTGETGAPPADWADLQAAQPEGTCAAWERVNALSSPLWRRAEAAGRPAGLVLWPKVLPLGCAQVASVQVEGWEQDLPAGQEEVVLTPAEGWQGLPASYSEPLHGTLGLSDEAGRPVGELHLAALDRRNDGTILYDHLLLDDDRDAGEGAVLFRTDEWADGWAVPHRGSAAAFRVLEMDQNPDVRVTLYRSPAYHLEVRPGALRERLLSEVGPLSPPPDLQAWQEGWLSQAQVLEMALRHGNGLGRVVEALVRQGGLAALWVRWTPLEQALQIAEGVDARVPSAGRQVLRQVDGEIGALLLSVDLSKTAVVALFLPAEESGETTGTLVAAGRGVRQGVVDGPWSAAEAAGFVGALMGLDAPAETSRYRRALVP